MRLTCPGCGVALQSEDPQQPGYVPPHVLAEAAEDTVCQRCYRIRHYGQLTGVRGPDPAVRQAIEQAVQEADATVLLLDLIDFEGSFRPELARGARRLVAAVNKVDLLPRVTPLDEAAEWAWQRLEGAGLRPHRVCLVSATKRYGIRLLHEQIRSLLPGSRSQVAVVGVTNAGKSTLLRALLTREEAERGPTVARFPGTTLGLVRRQLDEQIVLVDTPGVVPGDRLTDLLCPACAAHFVPAKELGSKLYRLQPGQGLGWGGVAAIALLSGPKGDAGSGSDGRRPGLDVLVYSADDVEIERARPRPDPPPGEWAVPKFRPGVCPECRERLAAAGWQRRRVELPEMMDLAVYGLGWISVRGGDCELEVTVPAGVALRLRPRLVGAKHPPRRVGQPGRQGAPGRPGG